MTASTIYRASPPHMLHLAIVTATDNDLAGKIEFNTS